METNVDRIKNRSTNIEVLRIACMLCIVFHHLACHGELFQWTSDEPFRILIASILLPGGKIAYDCFIAISVYFLANKELSGKRFMKIWLEVLFYNFLGLALSGIFYGGNGVKIVKSNIIGCLFPILGNSHGFASLFLTYILLLPCLQLIESRLKKYNHLALLVFLVSLQILQPIIALISKSQRFLFYQNPFLVFVIIYLLITYIKKYSNKFLLNRLLLKLVVCFVWLFTTAIWYMSVFGPHQDKMIKIIPYVTGDDSLLNIAAGISLFFLFLEKNIKYNKYINKLAVYTFCILLIHDHNFFRYVLWKDIVGISFWDHQHPLILIFNIIIISVLIYIICSFIDYLRITIFERILINTRLFISCSMLIEKYFDVPK